MVSAYLLIRIFAINPPKKPPINNLKICRYVLFHDRDSRFNPVFMKNYIHLLFSVTMRENTLIKGLNANPLLTGNVEYYLNWEGHF